MSRFVDFCLLGIFFLAAAAFVGFVIWDVSRPARREYEPPCEEREWSLSTIRLVPIEPEPLEKELPK